MNKGWRSPQPRNSVTQQIMANTLALDGKMRWFGFHSLWGFCYIQSTWKAIRCQGSLGFSGLVSQRSPQVGFFISWLCCLGRLATKDRWRSWGMSISPECVLCSQCPEAEAHLHQFFECSFSKEVWQHILLRCMIRRTPGNWNFELSGQPPSANPNLSKLKYIGYL